MKRVHISVSGRVQDVFFRAFAKEQADDLGLAGFAKNLDDGRVEIVAEGDEEQLKKFVETIKIGHPAARVENIDVQWNVVKNEFIDFRIMH